MHHPPDGYAVKQYFISIEGRASVGSETLTKAIDVVRDMYPELTIVDVAGEGVLRCDDCGYIDDHEHFVDGVCPKCTSKKVVAHTG